MQTVTRGYAEFFKGAFENENGESIDYFQLGVLENNDTGLQLVKVKVPKEKKSEAEKLGGQKVELLCDMKVYGKKTDFVFLKGKAA